MVYEKHFLVGDVSSMIWTLYQKLQDSPHGVGRYGPGAVATIFSGQLWVGKLIFVTLCCEPVAFSPRSGRWISRPPIVL